MDKKSRIFFLIPVLKGGGAERNVVNLVSNLDRNLFELTVIAGKVGGDLESELSKDIRLIDLKSSGSISLFFKLSKLLRVEKPDILVSSLSYVNIISMMVKSFLFLKTKVVLTEHTTVSALSFTAKNLYKRLIARFILPSFMKIFYPSADKIICVSEGVKEDLSLIIGNLSKIEVIYNPVFGDSISKLSKESLGEDQHIFEGAHPVIIAIGRLIKAKDYPNLLNAFKKVLNSHQARLLILGEGPEEKYLKDLASKLKIYNNVIFAGFKKNPYKYLAHSSVFVLSSIREGFGNVIVEAMGCGIPVIATNCKSGPAEIINNEVNGLLVNPANPVNLSDAIVKIMENPDFSKKLASNGLERAKYFSVEKSVNKYEEIFNKLINV